MAMAMTKAAARAMAAARSAAARTPAMSAGSRTPAMSAGSRTLASSATARTPAMSATASGGKTDHLKNLMEVYRRELALSHASIDKTMSLCEQNHRSLMKKFDFTEKACGVALVAYSLGAVVSMSNYAM